MPPIQIQEYLNNIRDNVGRLQSKIDSMKLTASEIRAADAIPKEYIGKAIPAREAVEIAYPFYIERIQGNITIPADGPFLATSIHFSYLIPYDPNANAGMMQPGFIGRWRPISTIETNIPNLSIIRPSDPMCADFYWEYEVSESHKKRQNIQQPSSLVHQEELGNGFFPLTPNDIFPKTSTVTIYVTTLGRYDNNAEYYQYPGILWCGFNGFYILEDY